MPAQICGSNTCAATLLFPATSAHELSGEGADDENLDLPPPDGPLNEDDSCGPVEEEENLDPAADLKEKDDDETGIDLDPVSLIDTVEDRVADAADLNAIDVGSLADDIALPDDEDGAADDAGPADDYEEPGLFDGSEVDDAGVGTGEDLGEFIDENALPSLGEGNERGLDEPLDAAFDESAPRWDRSRFQAASELSVHVPCRLLAVSGSRVVAAGPSVFVVRSDAGVSRGTGPAAKIAAVSALDDLVLVATTTGELLLSKDAGAAWASVGRIQPTAMARVVLASTPGRFWISQAGALWSVRCVGNRLEPPALVRKTETVAIAAAGSSLVVFSAPGKALALEKLRGDDETSTPVVLSESWFEGENDVVAAAACPNASALASKRSVLIARNGGESLCTHQIAGVRALAFAGDDDTVPLLALVVDPALDGAARVFDVGALKDPVIVAEIASGAHEHAAIAWDALREVLWVACDAGLIAFKRVARH
ncbi:MAG: hypothetical protein IPK82_16995 [Polyangiaceae bacterium]|nr:hypothetical protein [Polyangiaceae bacterium]